MRKLIVHEFVTLDGVMQAPGGKDEDRDGGFEHGGWTLPYWHDDIGAAFGALMQDVDAFLLGRKTYVTHAEAFEPLLHLASHRPARDRRVRAPGVPRHAHGRRRSDPNAPVAVTARASAAAGSLR